MTFNEESIALFFVFVKMQSVFLEKAEKDSVGLAEA